MAQKSKPTPQAMAEWLEKRRRDFPQARRFSFTEGEVDALVRVLRAQPTEAQKIEALQWAGEAGFVAAQFAPEYARLLSAQDCGHAARAAMRLLGIDPETP